MINFPRSTFTWESHPWTPDPHYKWPGGFVGRPGQSYHVRFNLESRCTLRDAKGAALAELFLGAPCRAEYTIARSNLFQVPSAEWRMAFSRSARLHIASRPSWEAEPASADRLDKAFRDFRIDVRTFAASSPLPGPAEIIEATLANAALNACTTYKDAESGLQVELEYPVNLINLNAADGEYQVCTGPLLLPDLKTWDGREVARVFLAHAAFSRQDRAEFILQRHIEAAPHEREWLDRPRGRDRLELIDPGKEPPGYPPPRPWPTVYNEVWDLEARNGVMKAEET